MVHYSTRHKMKITETMKNRSFHGLAISILKNSNRPLTVKEITERILRVKRIKGKTPNNTVNSILQYSEHAKRVGRGLYRYRP